MDWATILEFFSNPFMIAVTVLVISLFSQWIFTNWRIKRDFRIKLLEETFKPLYKLVSDIIETLERQRYDSTVWAVPRDLRETIISDVRFSMLKKDEQKIIEHVETVLVGCYNSIDAAYRKLRKLWDDSLQSLAYSHSDPLGGSIWASFMEPTAETAEDLIQRKGIDQEMKKTLIETARTVFAKFKTTQEYQDYIIAHDETLSTMYDFRESLMKWANRMFSLISR